MLKEKFAFLSSTRFWALILIAIVGVLKAEMVITDDVANGLLVILGGFIGIRTLDRETELISK